MMEDLKHLEFQFLLGRLETPRASSLAGRHLGFNSS